jgi:2-oxoglutarate/2-oxoacid ferredoxin oxidoreductase subunit alpha
MVPAAIICRRPHARCGLVTVGGCDLAVREAIEDLAARGTHVDYMRIRGFPFGDEVEDFLASHDTIFVIEQNRDGQLRTLLTMETSAPKEKLRSVREYGGFPLQAAQVVRAVSAQLPMMNNGPVAVEARE